MHRLAECPSFQELIGSHTRRVWSDANGEALIEAFSNIGRGVQQMQHAWFDILNKSIDRAARRPQDLLRCNSPVELAEAQRDLYREGVSYMVNATTTWLNLMAQTAQEAGRPLEHRAQRHAA